MPDIISIVDIENFEPITTELLKYGLRDNVLVLPAHDMLKESLEECGPKAFGYNTEDYYSIGLMKPTIPVIKIE